MTCPRCQGFIIATPDDTFCINCAYRLFGPEPIRSCQWRNKIAGQCRKNPMRGSDYCQEHEKTEARRRMELVKFYQLGEVEE
jgi:hypothetical protein